jgi:hypothetical protein
MGQPLAKMKDGGDVRLADGARAQAAARLLWNASQDRIQRDYSSLVSKLLRWCAVEKGRGGECRRGKIARLGVKRVVDIARHDIDMVARTCKGECREGR